MRQQIMLNLLQSEAPANVKVELLTASACLEYATLRPRQIKLKVTKYGFLHVYKLTTYLNCTKIALVSL